MSEIKIIPFKPFEQLIKDAGDIAKKITELYIKAQHNKKIAKILMERIVAANFAISLLQDDELHTETHYENLQKLVQVFHKMKNYSEGITQYSTLQFLIDSTELQFNELCKEYDDSIDSLNLSLMVDFKAEANAKRDREILNEEIENFPKFQEALLESMNTNDKNFMKNFIKQISEISSTMQTLENEEGEEKVIQKKIENIFIESPLPIKDYEETNTIRGVEKDEKDNITEYKYRKYVKGKTAFAFKTVVKEQIGQIKNQVSILKKIGDCQNVIRFYGFTKDSGEEIYYLITEWIENGNLYEYIQNHKQNIEIKLRLQFAYDIAKGLNFLNSVKILHRDIRSENVVIAVIADQKIAKITNFKLNKGFQGATGNLSVNKEAVRRNSPETLRRGISAPGKDKKNKYDTKSEVYSFGILLWELAECRTPYSQFEDFLEVTNSVINGYREPLTSNTGIPEKYQDLVNESIDQNPGNRPTFAKMLIDLQDIFKNYTPSGQPSHIEIPDLPKRIDNVDNETFSTTIDKAVENHHKVAKEKDKEGLSKCYKCFDAYAKLGNPKAKYWKAYYITKGWSDLPAASKKENLKFATDLFKEAADYGDEFSEAQLRYALQIMSQKKEEAIDYLLKAAKNGHVVAMFNVATYYFANSHNELGRYYMIMAANKKYPEAINYCKAKNIPCKYSS